MSNPYDQQVVALEQAEARLEALLDVANEHLKAIEDTESLGWEIECYVAYGLACGMSKVQDELGNALNLQGAWNHGAGIGGQSDEDEVE